MDSHRHAPCRAPQTPPWSSVCRSAAAGGSPAPCLGRRESAPPTGARPPETPGPAPPVHLPAGPFSFGAELPWGPSAGGFEAPHWSLKDLATAASENSPLPSLPTPPAGAGVTELSEPWAPLRSGRPPISLRPRFCGPDASSGIPVTSKLRWVVRSSDKATGSLTAKGDNRSVPWVTSRAP